MMTASGEIVPVGGMMHCQSCGKPILRTTSRKRYCPDCKERARQKTHRAADRRRRERLREAQQTGQAPEGGECIDSLKGKSADRVTMEARALGLSYGKYSALVASGGIRAYIEYHRIDWRAAFRREARCWAEQKKQRRDRNK